MNLNFTLVLQILSFLILLGLMTRFLYKPFVKYLDERAANIKKMLTNARESEERSRAYAEQTHQALEMAKTEALKMKEEAKRLSDMERRKVIEESKKEAHFLIEEAKKQIDKERDMALKEIKSEIADISIDIARKILGREIKPEDHKRIIEESISEIEDEIHRP
jgi:F-type H+-transporting ATPase subunit b